MVLSGPVDQPARVLPSLPCGAGARGCKHARHTADVAGSASPLGAIEERRPHRVRTVHPSRSWLARQRQPFRSVPVHPRSMKLMREGGRHMPRRCIRHAVAAALLAVAFAGSAHALVVVTPEQAADGLVAPAAMCGYSCRTGGRYIPGPPSVCREEGLSYCGPSSGGRYRSRDFDDEEVEAVRPRRPAPGGYGQLMGRSMSGPTGGAMSGSICVTDRGNCPSAGAPPHAPCQCVFPGFGARQGNVARP
jgi:hypothetical protein